MALLAWLRRASLRLVTMGQAMRRQWHHVAETRYWLYLLTLAPFMTDLVETGAIPSSLRGWTTELLMGILLAILIHQLRQRFIDAVALARTDALTGLGNRRAFKEALETEWARAQRSGRPITLVFIDLDNFKLVNDKFGHDAGDAALIQVAEAVHCAVRAKIDSGFRLGGDEFAVLLPSSDAAEAGAVVARIRARCASAPHPANDGIEFSAGIVELAGEETWHAFLLRADAEMYRQKHRRRSERAASWQR